MAELTKAQIGIRGDLVDLVPYKAKHVPKYHEWMTDPEMLKLTASEPLTLAEEYEMQHSWVRDPSKCTFILLDKSGSREVGQAGRMVGDVNLYWNDHDDPRIAEIEVMVAESGSRRKGIAAEALQLMMAHAVAMRNTLGFTAKITTSNVPSRRLFEKLGYVLHKEVACFDEVHYRFDVNAAPEAWSKLQMLADGFPQRTINASEVDDAP